MKVVGLLHPQIDLKKAILFSFFLIGCMVLSIFSSGKVMAQGNLLITPRRVVFEGKKKIQELNLANTGKDTATYNISFKQIRMTEDGQFEEITQPDLGQNFASNYLRFFPRRVTLAPNEAQLVKMQLVKTNLLQAGEYRSHIYFRGVPQKNPLGGKEDQSETTGLSVSLTPVFGITIPVIIRRGESTTQVSVSDLKFERDKDLIPGLGLKLNRTGNMSVYGDIRVNYISSEGKQSLVGLLKGLAVYMPTVSRTIRIKLENQDGIDYTRGKLHFVYSKQKSNKGGILCEAELNLH
ncbi:MAG: molecular chaperone [Bacteroidales bacterium]|nr:MAG: molecular chaperone [Bacteroidales bacterium]